MISKRFLASKRFGSDKAAFLVRSHSDKKIVLSVIPDTLRDRQPFRLDQNISDHISQADKQRALFSLRRKDAPRVLLVLCTIDKQKMCFVVEHDVIHLITLVISDPVLFTNHSVFECFLITNADGSTVLQISDVFIYAGERMAEVPFMVRKTVASVFVNITHLRSPADPFMIVVAGDEDIRYIQIGMHALTDPSKFDVIIHPALVPFDVQDSRGLYRVIDADLVPKLF